MHKLLNVKKYLLIVTILASTSCYTAYADSNKNSPYNDKSTSFKNNIDSFITAGTWYRPKMIRVNGIKWQVSKPNDFRPLLTVWWPDDSIKQNYVDFMSQNGLGNGINIQSNLDDKALLIQSNIERRIYSEHSVKWLKTLMNKFINSQAMWNMGSETQLPITIQNGLQNGGILRYGNNKLTPWANSNYRLWDRNGYNQNGHGKYPGNEYLLASDVDNSNPVVQSEDLNWLHYILNFGSINHRHNANFDSIRIDATGNIDIDVNDIAASYFRNALHANKNEYEANNHLSINEAGQAFNKDNDRLKIDPYLSKYQDVLTKQPDQRSNLNEFLKTNVGIQPTYSYLNTHDHSDVGKLLSGFVIKNKNNWISEVNNAIKEAGIKTQRDQLTTNKSFSSYNVPASYAMLLNEINIVPRVNYGDLYSETGKFMSKKTPYYNAITAMMIARKQYVSGNETKEIQNFDKNNNDNNDNNKQVLTLIRNGKTHTQGSAVILANNPNLKLNSNDKVRISMGKNHRNQLIRPVINTTSAGLKIYKNDNQAKNVFKKTDSKGDFYLSYNDLYGVNNPLVSGYVSMWVPVGAKENQDARTKANKKRVLKNKLIYPGEALDSNIIFEGFSNFQTIDKKPDTYKKIAKNAELLHDLGVTYYSFPPTYRSDTNDVSFTDTIFENGYGIKDRYDFGYNTPTKYGTANQLMEAIQSLHKHNVKAMADYVPNQIYGLNKQQVVSVTRTDWAGNYIGNGAMQNNLYVANSMGSGNDYQYKFGGKYLKMLKHKYPKIFEKKQISTGKTIDTSGKRLQIWSAKYLNGSQLQGRGWDYVLRDINVHYYKLGNNRYLPNDWLK